MKRIWTKILAAMLAIALTAGVLPVLTGTETSALAENGSYGKTTASDVNVRVKASTSADYLFRLPEGWVCTVVEQVASGGKTWYRVMTTEPNSNGSRTYYGYVHGDYFRMLSTEEAIAWEANPVQTAGPRPSDVPSGAALGKVTSDGVNFRQGPSTKSSSMFKVDSGTVMEVLQIPDAADPDPWYKVRYNGYTGYIMGKYFKVTTGGNTPAPATPTPAPTATPVPGTYGYIKTKVGAVNFRETTGGSVVDRVAKANTPFVVTGPSRYVGGYTWYPVVFNGRAGFLRSDVVVSISKSEYDALIGSITPAPTAGPDVTPKPTETTAPVGDSGHVITILSGLTNLRAAASQDASSKERVSVSTVMEYTGIQVAGGKTWYKVHYKGQNLYVRGDCVRVMTVAEYEAYIGGTTPVPTTTTATLIGYVKTTVTQLNVRKTADGANILGRIATSGTVLECYGTQKVGTTTWYNVKTAYGMGWITGKYAVFMSDPDVTATPDPAKPTNTPVPTTYPVLKIGSTGPAVRRLVTALKNLGFYTGGVTDTYNTTVKSAVSAFQATYKLKVDGIAGQETQTKLYSLDSGDEPLPDDFKLYPAEKIDWFTGGIDEMLPRGTNFRIYDVKTGNVWWAHRWAGGSHADIEPLTKADTAILCDMYGVSKASEIESKNLWQRRPCLITIGTRTFACSLYGVPHGTQTITDNNYDGQCCLHFTNSKTHDSQRVDSYHAEAIEYAWQNAPNGHK